MQSAQWNISQCVLSLNNYLNAGLNNICLLQGPSTSINHLHCEICKKENVQLFHKHL